MNPKILGLPSLLVGLAAVAHAQAPVFITLTSSTQPTDVSVTQANGVVVVGNQSGGAFRWTPTGGQVSIGVLTPSGTPVRISSDGSTIVGDLGTSPSTAAIWSGSGTTWNPIPSLGSNSGGTETTVGGVNADGTVLVGMGYTPFFVAHAFRYSGGVTVDADPPGNGDQSRAWAVSGNGNLIVGWDGGSQRGARFVSGIATLFNYVDPGLVSHQTGHALAVNHAGTIVVGTGVIGVSSTAWRWDSGPNAITLLPNLPSDTNNPRPNDLIDDGSLIVGNNGGNILSGGPKAVIWVNGVPQDLETYLVGLGMLPTGYTQLGNVTGISRDGSAIVGYGSGTGTQPGGWIVLFPSLIPNGTPFCAGDGTDATCPCTNPGLAGRGCDNTAATGGAALAATGDASVSSPSLVLHSTFAVPFGPGLYYEGNATANPSAPFGIPFGNGLRCAGGSTNRLEIRFADNTGAASTTVNLQAFGGALANTTYYYQQWYRDTGNVGTCTPGAGFNLSNALSVTWQP